MNKGSLLENRYSALTEETGLSIQVMSDIVTSMIKQCALAVRGKLVKQDTGKLSQETKYLIKKRQSMKASNTTERIAGRALKANEQAQGSRRKGV